MAEIPTFVFFFCFAGLFLFIHGRSLMDGDLMSEQENLNGFQITMLKLCLYYCRAMMKKVSLELVFLQVQSYQVI